MPGHAKILRLSVFLVGTLAAIFWLATLQQPLIDQHEFRQTQTALTALFLQPSLHGLLNYETPVLGHPWVIPFEFPLYQWLASLPARVLPISLGTSGRLISILFGVACLWPSLAIMRRFSVPANGRQIFILLYLTASIYLYWNRSFMIESTALFFTLLSLYTYTIMRRPSHHCGSIKQDLRPWHYATLAISLSLALLVKATTALPAFLLMGMDLALQIIASWRASRFERSRLHPWLLATCLLVSFLILRSWTHHADALKLQNLIGKYMTSEALREWNFGSLSQRFSLELWDGVLLQRMLTPWGALPAIGLLALGLSSHSKQQEQKRFIAACLFLALSPLLIFTNLHVQHNYYQSANQIYLLAALASSGSLALEAGRQAAIRFLAAVLIVLFVASSVVAFKSSTGYFSDSFTKESVKLDIGRLIQSRTTSGSVLLVFDDDWSSAFSFHSMRRSLTIPGWFKDIESRQALLTGPTEWLGSRPLGAIITKQLLNNDEEAALRTRCAAPTLTRFPEWNVYLCQTAEFDAAGRRGT